MPAKLITCRECGKEMSSELNVCPECGYVRRRTRATKEQAKRALEPASSQVAAVTEAVRVGPKREPRKPPTVGRRARSRRQDPAPRPAPAMARRANRYTSRGGPEGATADPTGAAQGPDAPVRVRELARRKVYRYGQEKHKRSRVSREVKVLIIMVVAGLCLVLMCQVQKSEASAAGPGGHRTGVARTSE